MPMFWSWPSQGGAPEPQAGQGPLYMGKPPISTSFYIFYIQKQCLLCPEIIATIIEGFEVSKVVTKKLNPLVICDGLLSKMIIWVRWFTIVNGDFP